MTIDMLHFQQLIFKWSEKRKQSIYKLILNTYRTAVSPTLDLLCHEDFSVGRSEADSNIEIFIAQ